MPEHADRAASAAAARAPQTARRCRAAECRDEFPPPHSITSSARASSDGGHSETERLGGLKVDRQLELGRLLDRQVGRLLALEDAVHVAGRAAVLIARSGAIAHQASIGRRNSARRRWPAIGAAAASATIRSRWRFANGRSPSRSGRPCGSVANAARARSISAASRTSTRLTLHAQRRRHGLTRRIVRPRGDGRIRGIAARVSGAQSLSAAQATCRQARFNMVNAGRVAARPRQTGDETGADGIDDHREHDRHRCVVASCSGADRIGPVTTMTSGAARPIRPRVGESRRRCRRPSGMSMLDVSTVDPAQLLQALEKGAPCGPALPGRRRRVPTACRCAACARPAARAPRAATPPRRRVPR